MLSGLFFILNPPHPQNSSPFGYVSVADEVKSLHYAHSQLTTELQTLRSNPSPTVLSHESLNLKQLSLAHRKLSLLLDETEDRLRLRTDEWVNERAYRSRAEGLLEELRRRERKREAEGLDEKSAEDFREDDGEADELRKELEREKHIGDEERKRRIELEVELDRRNREDKSASAVVERYMYVHHLFSLYP